MGSKSELLGKAEIALAVGLTVASILLHLQNFFSAGGLWRDEANTIGLATLPTLAEVWKNLQYDSFPLCWMLVIRGYAWSFGSMNDHAFRLLGLLVGVSSLLALWLLAKRFKYSAPIVSLTLIGLSPSIIRWGDSMRAYGFGILFSILITIVIWTFLEKPSIANACLLLGISICGVHSSFYNSVVLFALSIGACAVCYRKGTFKVAGAVLLSGFLSAVSLIPYATTIRDASTWNILVRIPEYNFLWFCTKFTESIHPTSAAPTFFWLALVCTAILGGSFALHSQRWIKTSKEQQNVILFGITSLTVGFILYYCFLKTLSYYTQPWYYLTLLVLIAICVDAILGSIALQKTTRFLRVIIATLFLISVFLPVKSLVSSRLTNVDLITAHLRKNCSDGDVILINTWHYGVSFYRYFGDSNSWMTLPDISFHRFHRYDLFKQKMMHPDQLDVVSPVLDRITDCLRSGHNLYLVGELQFLRPGEAPFVLPPAPKSKWKWNESLYNQQWSAITGSFVQKHALKAETLPIDSKGPVNGYENLQLTRISGWRE